jgi:hypothetical protein
MLKGVLVSEATPDTGVEAVKVKLVPKFVLVP